MSEDNLIEAVRNGDRSALKSLLSHGVNAEERDEHGWTPLAWAAGRGDLAAVRVLLGHGADCAAKGRDQRTPLMIAKAAGHGAVAAILTEAEQQRGIWIDPRQARRYCRAYHLAELRRCSCWSENRIAGGGPAAVEGTAGAGLKDEDIVYLHQDLTVTASMWHGEGVIFDQITPEWREFCERQVGFAVPADLV
jgi:hypothetical protein